MKLSGKIRRQIHPCRVPVIYVLLLLSGLVTTSPASSGDVFATADLEKLLRAHPIVSQYDPVQKRFRGTPSEFPDRRKISSELETVRRELAGLDSTRALGIASHAVRAREDELWVFLSEVTGKRDRLLSRERELTKILNGPEKTPDSSILPIVKKLANEITSSLPNAVVLNRFPEIVPPEAPFEGWNPYRHFLDESATESLALYLRAIPAVRPHFPTVREPLLYQRPGLQHGGMH